MDWRICISYILVSPLHILKQAIIVEFTHLVPYKYNVLIVGFTVHLGGCCAKYIFIDSCLFVTKQHYEYQGRHLKLKY